MGALFSSGTGVVFATEAPSGSCLDWELRIEKEVRRLPPACGDIARLCEAAEVLEAHPLSLGELVERKVEAGTTKGRAAVLKDRFAQLMARGGHPSAKQAPAVWAEVVSKFDPESLQFDLAPLLRAVLKRSDEYAAPDHLRTLNCFKQGIPHSAFERLLATIWQPWMTGHIWDTRDWKIFCWFEGRQFAFVNVRTEVLKAVSGVPGCTLTWAVKVTFDPAEAEPSVTSTMSMHSLKCDYRSPLARERAEKLRADTCAEWCDATVTLHRHGLGLGFGLFWR